MRPYDAAPGVDYQADGENVPKSQNKVQKVGWWTDKFEKLSRIPEKAEEKIVKESKSLEEICQSKNSIYMGN